jgi:enoyl-CoA hydratase/carnithine racemase
MVHDFAGGLLRYAPGRVALVTIANPARRNAISQSMWAALPAIAAAIAADPAVRAVVLTAEAGPQGPAFSAGADISEFETVYATAASTAAYNALVRGAQAAWRDLPRPVIAAVAGPCVGGGCGLALACDLRFAAAGARFGITPARLGLGYSWADTAQLVEKVGPARAKDMLFSGRLLPADEALATGLVERVFPDDRLMDETRSYAAMVADLSPVSHRVTKATVNALSAPTPVSDDVRRLFDASFDSADFAEGRRAFMGRRKPDFPG